MYAVPSASNVVHVTYTRSRNALAVWLSTVMNGLSSRKSPAPAASLCSATGWPGKLNDAPFVPVDRNTYIALDWSGLGETPAPRLNTWQVRYALPRVSQATEVSPPACQYSRAVPHVGVPRANPFGVVESAQLFPPSSEYDTPQVPSPRR